MKENHFEFLYYIMNKSRNEVSVCMVRNKIKDPGIIERKWKTILHSCSRFLSKRNQHFMRKYTHQKFMEYLCKSH